LQAREGRVAIGIAHLSLDPHQIVNVFREFHREMVLWRFSCFFIARMNGFAIFGSSESGGSASKEQGDETRTNCCDTSDANASASSPSNNNTIIGVVVDCLDIGNLLQQYASVRPFDKLYCCYLNTYPWDMQTIQYQGDGVGASDVCIMKGCFKDLQTQSAVQPDFDIMIKLLIGHSVLQHERGKRAACGLLNASCQLSSHASDMNTHEIGDPKQNQLKLKRKALLRKEQRRNQNALVARLDAVRLYGLAYGLVSLVKA
jgi:hypothetical protein